MSRPRIPGIAACVGGLLLLRALVPAESRPGDHAPPLPQWTGDARLPPGPGLWPDDFRPEDIVHPALAQDGAADAPQVSEEESWLRFLPGGLFQRKSRTPVPPPPLPLEDLPAESLSAAVNAPATSRLLDPQGLVGEAQTEDVARLLASHAERASVDAFFLLIDRYQQVRPGADLSQIASGGLTRGANCLAIFPLGAPERARLLFTHSVVDVVPASYLSGLAADCVRDAMESSDPVEQFERYAVQLCIHLFWMERAYPAIKPPPLEVRPAVLVPETLHEVARAGVPPPAAPKKPESGWRVVWTTLALSIAAIIAVAVAAAFFIRTHRRRSRLIVWLLPEYHYEHPATFGGPHCGGCGASLKYG